MIFDRIKQYKHISFLLLLILFSSLGQSYHIGRDFNGLHEYDAAQYSLYAKNLLEYGLKTKLIPVSNINPLTGSFTYYLYHPFLTVYAYALFFKIFGPTILIGRLISMFFFSLGTVCLYLLVSKLFNKHIALWTCFFYVLFPVSQYFGKFVCQGTVIIPFILLFILFYYLWITENKPIFFGFMMGSFILACATDWQAYYLAPITIIHYRYFLKNKNRRIFILLYAGVLFFILFLFFNYFLTGSISGTQSQWPVNIQAPSSSGSETIGVFKHALKDRMHYDMFFKKIFYSRLAEHLLNSFTFPILCIILFFLFNYRKFKYLSGPAVYILFVPALYLSHGLVFPKGYFFDHIQMTVYLSTAFATISALVISRASKFVKIILVGTFLLFSIINTHKLYNMNNTNQEDFMLGKTIPLLSHPEEGIAVSQPFFSPFTEYFSHRKILYDVTSWEKVHYIIHSDKVKYFITDIAAFQDYLMKRFPVIFLPDHFMAFDTKAQTIPLPERKYKISFVNNISLVNFSYKRLPNDYLLLEYTWGKNMRPTEQFMVFVHFEDIEGRNLFGQDHFIANGFNEMIKTGEDLFRETYIIKIPDNALEKELSVYIGLYSPITYQRVQVLSMTAKDNRVYLGKIL
jgi:hypothetical protein